MRTLYTLVLEPNFLRDWRREMLRPRDRAAMEDRPADVPVLLLAETKNIEIYVSHDLEIMSRLELLSDPEIR